MEALVRALAGIVGLIGRLFPTMPKPAWLESFEGWLSDLGAAASGLGSWLPLDRAVQAAGFVLACLGVALAIRLIRVLLSLFTGGGGSAA